MLFGFSAVGTIEVGVLYAFISYLGRLNEPLIELTTQQSMLQQAVVAGERVFELMDRPRRAWGTDDAPLSSGRVEIDHLSFAYRGTVWFSVISRWIFPPAASWRWSDIPAAEKYPRQSDDGLLPVNPRRDPHRWSTARIPQPQRVASGHRDGATGSRSAGGYLYANVALGRDISEAQVWEALEAVQLAAVARSMSDGLYTQLGEQGNNLSVGQKQLLALARVLVDTRRY